MKTLGTRLLHTHSLINIIEPMSPNLFAAGQQLLAQDPDLSEEELRRELRN